MSDTTPNNGNRTDQKWDENPSNTGEVREPADNPEAAEERATEQHSDEHHAANETDPNGYTGTGSHSAASEPEAAACEPVPVKPFGSVSVAAWCSSECCSVARSSAPSG